MLPPARCTLFQFPASLALIHAGAALQIFQGLLDSGVSPCTSMTSNLTLALQGHSDWVRDVAWAPNMGLPCSTIASCGQDGQVLAWSEKAEGGWDKRLVVDVQQPVWRLSWSVSGNILAVSYGANSTSLWKEAVDGTWQQLQH